MGRLLRGWMLGYSGWDGFVVLGHAEVGGELELLVETTAGLAGCPEVWRGGADEGPPPDLGAWQLLGCLAVKRDHEQCLKPVDDPDREGRTFPVIE